jgi:hypothetical protein
MDLGQALLTWTVISVGLVAARIFAVYAPLAVAWLRGPVRPQQTQHRPPTPTLG